MKNLVILFLVFTYSALQAQDKTIFPADSNGKITYTEVISLNDSIKKDELFSRAKSTFVNLFKNSNRVIQNEDPTAGNITGKGNFPMYAKFLGSTKEMGSVSFTVSILVKDGKYKYVITDFNHSGNGGNVMSGGNLENGKPKNFWAKAWNEMMESVDVDTKYFIKNLKTEMLKPSPKADNW